jgi:Kef-type K+ transport system membrane component KefB
METFGPAGHVEILQLLIQLAVLLFTARLFGEVAQRFGQPAVIGEILAGVFLGNSFLSSLVPELGFWILPQSALQGHLLEVVSMLGAVFLLVLTGLEIDLPLIRRHLKTAVSIGFFELSLTFALGFFLAGWLPDSLIAAPDQRFLFQLFVGTALAISAIPVMAKVLLDLNLMRRNIGQTIMAVGMIDDTVAWVLLSIVLAMVNETVITPLTFVISAGKIFVFIGLTFTLGRWIIVRFFNFVQERSSLPEKSLTLVIFFALAAGAIAQSLHVEAVLGAFLVGIIFGTIKRLPSEAIHKVEGMTIGIFAPIFFAVAGLKVDLTLLSNPEMFGIAMLVLFIATFGKLIGAFIGAKLAGKDNWHALAFGSALNARGAVEIIIASIGLKTGIIAADMYTIIVIMAVTTSVLAPFMLRYAVTKLAPDPEEQQRLKQEKLASESIVASFGRVLMPTRVRAEGAGQTQIVASAVLNRLATRKLLELTLLSVTTKEQEQECQRALMQMSALFPYPKIDRKVIVSDKPAETILDEAQREYNLLVLGATERTTAFNATLFNPMVDYLVRTSPSATMVIQGGNVDLGWQPNRILVPVSGTTASRNAVDVALNLAVGPDSEVVFVHVIQEELGDAALAGRRSFSAKEEQIGHQILRDAKARGDLLHVKTSTLMRTGTSVDAVVLDVAAKNGIDIIVLGTSIRPGTDRLFLGPRVERMLYLAKCPVLVMNN